MSSTSRRIDLPDLATTENFAAGLARAWQRVGNPPALVTLQGELGAGKTELVRMFLHALGHAGPVPSPTYSLVVPYALPQRRVLHLDLYRIGEPAELHALGLDDDWSGALILVEWPERGVGVLPAADITIALAGIESGSSGQRRLDILSSSEVGDAWLQRLF